MQSQYANYLQLLHRTIAHLQVYPCECVCECECIFHRKHFSPLIKRCKVHSMSASSYHCFAYFAVRVVPYNQNHYASMDGIVL